MLRLIVQTKRKYKKKEKKNKADEETESDEEPTGGKTHKEDSEHQQDTEDETDEGNRTNTECDQDSDVSFLNDTDEDIDTAEVEEECIENTKKKSTKKTWEGDINQFLKPEETRGNDLKNSDTWIRAAKNHKKKKLKKDYVKV